MNNKAAQAKRCLSAKCARSTQNNHSVMLSFNLILLHTAHVVLTCPVLARGMFSLEGLRSVFMAT